MTTYTPGITPGWLASRLMRRYPNARHQSLALERFAAEHELDLVTKWGAALHGSLESESGKLWIYWTKGIADLELVRMARIAKRLGLRYVVMNPALLGFNGEWVPIAFGIPNTDRMNNIHNTTN